MFAQLGDIQFNLITYFDGMNASRKINYAEHATIEGKPRLQYIGDALETITIKLNFHASFCDPTAELKKLKDASEKHEAMAFVLGNGVYRGNYVIEEIADTVQQTFKDGTLIAVDQEITLKEWVKEKTLETKKSKGGKKAKAKAKTKKRKTGSTKAKTDKDNVSRTRIVRQS